MRRKYRRTGSVILSIFVVAVICVIAVVIIIYQNGLRYIKSDMGIKYFGTVDKNGNIVSGRLWFESDAATVNQQKFFIIELRDPLIVSYLSDISNFRNFDILNAVNEALPKDFTDNYPMHNFIFNLTDDRIYFKNETFDVLIKEHQDNKNYLVSGEILDSDGINWVLVSDSASPVLYTDFEVAQVGNTARRYKGDILSYVKKEDIDFASFVFKDGTVINLYSVKNLYRINFDKGSRSGELYIGALNRSFAKDGLGLYYFSNRGDIYFGDFLNDYKKGYCQLLCDGGDTYVGEIKDDKRNGVGYYKWKEGDSYSGTFKDNLKNGNGINTFSDGSVYDGDFADNIKTGHGKYTFPDGSVYEGDFANDTFKGKGKYSWASGEYYEGDFNYNSMHGWGTYYWTTGRTYEGWWNGGAMVLEKPEGIE
jgi:hypothetical protein